MPPRRPPIAALTTGLAFAIAVACAQVPAPPPVAEPPPPAPGPVAAPPPAAEAALAEAEEPAPEAVAASSTVVLPEITAVALARRVLRVEAGRRLTEEQREQVARVLADAEQNLDLEVLLVLALMTQESRFDPRAVGPAGSLGLMQIRPWVGKDIAARYGLPWKGDESLFEPAYNVRLGTYYFAEMMEMFGEPELALAAYNMGPYRVRRLLKQGHHDLRPDFVDHVFGHYDALYDRFRRSETGWGG